jgi:hypothetical protein
MGPADASRHACTNRSSPAPLPLHHDAHSEGEEEDDPKRRPNGDAEHSRRYTGATVPVVGRDRLGRRHIAAPRTHRWRAMGARAKSLLNDVYVPNGERESWSVLSGGMCRTGGSWPRVPGESMNVRRPNLRGRGECVCARAFHFAVRWPGCREAHGAPPVWFSRPRVRQRNSSTGGMETCCCAQRALLPSRPARILPVAGARRQSAL